MLNIIGHRKIYYTISGTVILISIFAVALFGLELGIDFKGGSTLEVSYVQGARPAPGQVEETLKPLNLGAVKASPIGDNGMLIRLAQSDEKTHQDIFALLKNDAALQNSSVEERRFSSIGPTIGAELKKKAVGAIIIVLLAISLYIAWAFRQVSRPVSSWRYGVTTLIALFHDVTIPVGLFAYLGRFYGIEIDSTFIVALLVVLGFSVHDTIVVFDRIRENLKHYVHLSFEEVVNRSVNETLVRSINTSLTVLLTLTALLLWGGASLRYFVLALLVGISAGTYSSIFIASPVLVSWHKRLSKR